MADKEEVLIEIVVSNEAATKAIFESQQAIERMKQSQTELNKSRKEGTLTDEEYSKKSTAIKVAIDQQKESIRQNEKELRNNIKIQKDNIDSLASMKAQLSNNINAYEAMSQAQLNTAEGKEFTKSILDLTEKIKDAEEASGRFQRNVGNYPGLTKEAGKGVTQMTGFLGKMESQIGLISPKMGALVSSFSGFAGKTAAAASDAELLNKELKNSGEAMSAVEGFAGKASGSLDNLSTTSKAASTASTGAFSSIASGAKALGTVFLTPPIIVIAAVVGAIVAAFMLLKKGFELNDAAGDKMSESMATLRPILDAVGKIAGFFAEAISELVGFMAEAISGTVDFIAGILGMETGMSGAAQASRDLVKAQNELEDAERNFTVNSAERALKRAKLLSEVADKENLTAEERIARLKDANELDKKDLEDKKALAFENYRILVTQANAEKNTSDEVADKIAAARVRALGAYKEYFEGQKEINKKLSAAEAEMEAERKKAFDDYNKRLQDRLAKEKQAIEQLQDLTIGLIKDDLQRQIEAEEIKTKRANDELKNRLKNEENLTKAAREAINQIILINEQNLETKLSELKDKAREENIKKEFEAKQTELQANLELQTKGSQDELNLKIAKLRLQRSVELENKEITEVEKLAINKKYLEQEDNLNKEFLAKNFNDLKENIDKEFQLKILQFQNSKFLQDEILLAELEREQIKQSELAALDEATKIALYGNQLNYQIAVEESLLRVEQAQDNVTAAQLNSLNSFNTAMTSISQSIGDILSNLSEDSYEAAQFQKALALFNIGIALSTSIASIIALSSRSSVTIFDYLANVLAGTASVVAGVAKAKQAFAATPEPKKPSFASGGLIVGQGTGTSDSIQANVSNGESILTASSTSMFSPLLSALNQLGGGVAFGAQDVSNQVQGEDMLARAFAKGVSLLPPPVVSVKEINNVQERVTVLENL